MSFNSFTLSAVFAVFVSGLVYYYLNNYEHVVIKTNVGILRGFKSISRDGRPFSSFRSIPFAKPPVGDLRFEPPIEFEKWETLRDAIAKPPLCLQADPMWNKILGEEDCLYLNVFTPMIPKSGDGQVLPVMVFLHPGYFMFGGSEIANPVYFMDEDVVIVTTHYRLGALGFLNSGDEIISGNMGLKDQVMALKWVQSNIREFGGDPNTVTIFGESAGAASVHFHLFSPLSSGLFHRAVSQSGSSLCPWTDLEKDTKTQARKLGETLNCPDVSNSQALATCLKSLDARKITETQVTIFEEFFGPPEGLYGPTLEKDTAKNPFLTKHPRDLYSEGKFSKVPYLTGVNSEEGCWFSIDLLANKEFSHKFYKEWNTLAPKALLYSRDSKQSGKILHEYFGEQQSTFTQDDYQNLTAVFSDRYFLTCHAEMARLHSKFGGPTYLYYLNRTNLNSLGILLAATKRTFPLILELLIVKLKYAIGLEDIDYGVCHSDDLQYQFDALPTYGIYKSSPHYEFSKDFVKLWVAFGRNGYPGKYKGIEWTTSDSKLNRPPQYMNFGHPGGMIDEPFTARTEFWKNLHLNPR